MKRKILYVALGTLIIINITAFATLTYHRCCGRYDECVHAEVKDRGIYLCQELSLSESQIKDMDIISKNFHLIADSINSVLNNRRFELINMLTESNPDKKKIDSQTEEVNALHAELQKNVIHYLLEKKGKLTPEQQNKFFAIIQERFQRQSKCKKSSNLNLMREECNPNCQQSTN
jgi:Spy/CpxP family protein refolding chaperone